MTATTFRWPVITDRDGDLPALKRLLNTRMGDLERAIVSKNTDLGWINVKDFGAAGNGATDDTAALLAAEAVAAARETVLYFPPGFYLYDTTLGLAGDGSRIFGAGRHSVVLQYTGNAGAAVQLAGAGQRGAGIESVRIECLGTGSTCIAATANIGQVQLLDLQLVPSATGKGVDLSAGNSSTTYLREVRCGGGDVGFDFASVGIANNTINAKNLFVTNSGAIGIRTGNVLNCMLDGCAVDAHDIAYLLGGFGVTLTGCSCEDNTVRGYYVAGAGVYTFINCASANQRQPWVVDSAGARVTWINPQTLATPVGEVSIRIVSIGEGLLVNADQLDVAVDPSVDVFLPNRIGHSVRMTAGPSTLSTSPLAVGLAGAGFTVAGSNASGADVAAGDLTTSAPRSTGMATPGRFVVQAGQRTTTGTAVQSLYTALISGINDGTLFDTYLNSPAGPDAVRLVWAFNAAIQAIVGAAGTANQVIAGSAAGDLCLRVQSGRQVWSVDGGASIHGLLSTAGLALLNDIESTGVKAAIVSTAVDLTLSAAHYTVLVDATAAARTITLPVAAAHTKRVYVIKKVDASANTVTIDGNGAELIDGTATRVIATQYASVTIQSDGTAWWIQ